MGAVGLFIVVRGNSRGRAGWGVGGLGGGGGFVGSWG